MLHHSEGELATFSFIERVEDLTEYIIWREEIEHRHTGANLNGVNIAKDGQCGFILMLK